MTPAPVWSASAIPQPPKLSFATLSPTVLCEAGRPRSSATLIPTPLPSATFPIATEYEVLFRSIPDPRFPVTTLRMIRTWSAATGPVGPSPIVTIPSASWFGGSSGLASSTVSPVTVTYDALMPTPYTSPAASMTAPCSPSSVTRRSTVTIPGYVPAQTSTVPPGGAASIASWIESYRACRHESPDADGAPVGET